MSTVLDVSRDQLTDAAPDVRVSTATIRSRRSSERQSGTGGRVVLYTSSECWRGAGVSFVNIARGLVNRGFRPQIVSMRDEVTYEFAAAGLPVVELPRGRGESWRLRKFLASSRAEVLVVDRAHDLRVGALAVSGTGIALVNRYNHFRPEPPTDLLIRIAYHVAVRELIFLSGRAREDALRDTRFMRRATPTTIYEGIDVDLFRPCTRSAITFRRELGIGEEPFILAVGALSPEKRYDFLLNSLARLGPAAPKLVICGEGQQERQLRSQAAALGLSVSFTGRISQSLLIGAYSASLGLVHAGAVETFGLAVLEAMACGRPVIASAGGALPEVIGSDGACGILVPPASTEEMSKALIHILSNPGSAAAMGRRARARAERHFSLEAMEEAYATVIGRHTRPDSSRDLGERLRPITAGDA